MFRKIIKSVAIGVIMSLVLAAMPAPAHAGTPHTSYGVVTGGTGTDGWVFYVVARPTQTLTGTLTDLGSFVWQAQVGNLPTPWADGDDSIVYVARETNAGTSTHTGYYAIMNEDLDVLMGVQDYNACTIRQIPVPTATAGSGDVDLSWSAATEDSSETPHGSNITGYNIYRSTSQATGFSQIGTSTGTTYSDTTGTGGTTYYYTIEPVLRGDVDLGIYSANSNSVVFPTEPGQIQLSASSYSVSEGGGSVTITVRRVSGSDGAASINYATSNGTATAGSDYTAASGTLNWTDGDSANKTFNVTINDDVVDEPNETFTVTLSGPTGAILGSPASATVTINDNDATPVPGSLQFSSSTYSVSEGGGSATITVTRTGGSDGAVGISYATSNGTATAGSDYTAASGTLNWADGDSASKTFNVAITDDGAIESAETVNLAVTSPTGGATLGSPNTATLTINDNDTPGAPTITQFEMTAAPGVAITEAAEGDGVSIIGTNFGATQGGSTVVFYNGVPVTGIWYWSDTKIDLQVPTGATTGNVTVTVGGQPVSASLTITTVTTGPSITQFEMTAAPGVAITEAAIGDGISIIGTDFGATQDTVVFYNGVTATDIYFWSDTKIDLAVPTGAETGNVTVTVGTDSDNALLTITGGDNPVINSIDGFASHGGYPGETFTINGSNFGATIGSSTVTVGGLASNPTAWSDTQITTSVPTGVASGAANVVVTTTGGSISSSVNLRTDGAYIDDVEGGSVGTWGSVDGLADSGYYSFGTGITPDNTTIVTDGPQAGAAHDDARGMSIRYSYVSDWGGGWGATLANVMDLSALDPISFYIQWDGSANEVKLSLKDADGTGYAATVSNTALTTLTGYARVTLYKSQFSYDVDGSDVGADTSFDWTQVAGYSMVYTTQGTSTNYHYIDTVVAGDVTGGGGDVITEIIIDNILPPSGPAGTQFTATGEGFGASQGQSILVFENNDTHINYQVVVTSWSNATIEAVVPALAPIGTYTIKVIKIEIAQGAFQALESNEEGFQVTNTMSASGIATVYPNPFNPLETTVPAARASGLMGNVATIAFQASGINNIGIYIYDSTGRLVHKSLTSSTQIAWDGTDMGGNVVADGVYLLRIVNEENKSLIAKAKILVVKRIN